MRKLKNEEINYLNQGDVARKGQNWFSDPAWLTLEPVRINSILCKTYLVDN